MEKILKEILKILKRIEQKIDKQPEKDEGTIITNPETLKVLQEYERRDLANYLIRKGPPKRLCDECPKCYENGKVVKGILIETIEFKNSVVHTFKCPVCGHKWVCQIRTTPK